MRTANGWRASTGETICRNGRLGKAISHGSAQNRKGDEPHPQIYDAAEKDSIREARERTAGARHGRITLRFEDS